MCDLVSIFYSLHTNIQTLMKEYSTFLKYSKNTASNPTLHKSSVCTITPIVCAFVLVPPHLNTWSYKLMPHPQWQINRPFQGNQRRLSNKSYIVIQSWFQLPGFEHMYIFYVEWTNFTIKSSNPCYLLGMGNERSWKVSTVFDT